jgi:lipopolysaccharide/colanic/teichoic acid biosynthesis glycosyltransferase
MNSIILSRRCPTCVRLIELKGLVEAISQPTASAKLMEEPPNRPVYRFVKRAGDIVTSSIGLVVTGPFLLLAALAIKADSPGPVFFRQERVGRGFRPFRIFKFRTMVVDAPKLGAQITAGADPRITRIGRVLRKSKIDELPQLINVLVGDMSLVGPRPEVPKYVELFRNDYRFILSVRPGITDPASLKYRDEAAVLATCADPEHEYVTRILPEKIAISKHYLESATTFCDLKVILKTVCSR